MSMRRTLIGFDFYGAGNVGDDLTLQGFLHASTPPTRNDLCGLLRDDRLPSQRRRFGGIDWRSVDDTQLSAIRTQCSRWLGIGGTPFQASSGPWLLNSVLASLGPGFTGRTWMIGVGCETEVRQHKALAARVAASIDHIWTRDVYSHGFLVDELGVDAEKLTVGGDLANIALSELFPEFQPEHSSENVGILYYEEVPAGRNVRAMRQFARDLSRTSPVTFLATDVRDAGFERGLHRRMFGGWRSLGRSGPGFYAPDYQHADVHGLVSHFSNYSVVMASRYHALLAAAWAGCRVVALDRSSKVRWLSADLDIPLVSSPFTQESLRQGLAQARRVSRASLRLKLDAALASVRAVCRLIDEQR